jgi:hypothetical protein
LIELSSLISHRQEFFVYDKDATSPAAKWYKGMKQKMVRLIFERKIYLDEPLDNSANEIYLDHVRDISEAYSRAGTPKAANRKCAIKTLWRAGGRGGEPAAVAYSGMKWNVMHGTLCLECPQPKGSKLKLIPFPAGIDRHADWCLDFGDMLCLERGSTVWNSEKKVFMLPDLVTEKQDGTQSIAGASTKIGGYIKDLQPRERGGAAGYQDVAIETLPPQPTAAGLRPGAADTLCVSIPAELAIHNTGHDATGISALWNYLDPRVALCMPGAIVLAGWPPLPYGQIGRGPVHPSLVPIINMGISLVRLDRYIDPYAHRIACTECHIRPCTYMHMSLYAHAPIRPCTYMHMTGTSTTSSPCTTRALRCCTSAARCAP